ncbi:MAG: hypothetical protein NTW76_08690 [Corynebacteriales bacterium]|nr:hypothetical protein [Mycobacteriales bacterium]
MITGPRHQLFATVRPDSDRDVADLDTYAWSLVTELCRALDRTVVGHSTQTLDDGVTVTSVGTDETADPITITTFWRHACTVVDIPSGAAPDPRTTGAVLEAEVAHSEDFAVVAGATHPVGGHMTSVYEVLWCDNSRRHWERADLGPTLEDLD